MLSGSRLFVEYRLCDRRFHGHSDGTVAEFCKLKAGVSDLHVRRTSVHHSVLDPGVVVDRHLGPDLETVVDRHLVLDPAMAVVHHPCPDPAVAVDRHLVLALEVGVVHRSDLALGVVDNRGWVRILTSAVLDNHPAGNRVVVCRSSSCAADTKDCRDSTDPNSWQC